MGAFVRRGPGLVFLFVLSSFFLGNLHAKVENHFKRVEGKSEFNKMKNIDFIYMINLDQRPEKFETSAAMLRPFGIYPCRFSAVNGWELSLETINDVGVKFTKGMRGGFWGTRYSVNGAFETQDEIISQVGEIYFSHCMGRAPIGITLSHLSILQDAYDSGYNTIWVMEDDIELIKDPRLLSTMIEKLDKEVGNNKWDVLFTDRDTKNRDGVRVPCTGYAQRPNFTPSDPGKFSKEELVGKHFRKIGARYGAYSMIIRRSGIKKILNFYKKYDIFLPYDMEYIFPENIRLYTVTNDIISTQPRAITDNAKPYYLDKKGE